MSLIAELAGRDRLRIRVKGAVQGVGFRPFVHGLAERYELSGFVLNDADGVLVEVEGGSLDAFLAALRKECPPLARIDTVDVSPLAAQRLQGFAIRSSIDGYPGKARIPPDAATCRSCLDEMCDRASRFHLYPFVTCTHCGPRFTITHRLPYDRANTSMAGFDLCIACQADYGNSTSRRFHAETIACSECGPHLSHSLEEIAATLRDGKIVALKGIGGFHLLCDAANETTVETLRYRKRRLSKPFAIMVANAASVQCFGAPSLAEEALLSESGRPIVLVKALKRVVHAIIPGLARVGIMLPSAPVHHLLFHVLAGSPDGTAWLSQEQHRALVVTSGNAPGHPIAADDAEAFRDLSGIADMIVTHDRPIVARADDSVMAVIDGASACIRRSRGYVPEPIDLGRDGPSVIAVGAHLKAALCVTRGREAFLSQHIGDLGTAAAVRFYKETASRLLRTLDVSPDLAVCDLHPDYRSTLFAEAMELPVLRVQHHVAHLASVAAEHQLQGSFIGAALDGHGYGNCGDSWGGELIMVDGARWRRVGHLFPLALPGGERAAREAWRMGVSALTALGRGFEAELRFPGVLLAGRVGAILSTERNGPLTTSMGRLFDAAAALLGVCTVQNYEGQAAMELEALVHTPQELPLGYMISGDVLDFRPLLASLIEPGLTRREGAELFHGTLIAGLAEWIGRIAWQMRQTQVVLSGGCMTNRVIAEGLLGALRYRGFTPLLPHAVPPNDGGLSLGQAAMGRAHLMAGGPRP